MELVLSVFTPHRPLHDCLRRRSIFRAMAILIAIESVCLAKTNSSLSTVVDKAVAEEMKRQGIVGAAVGVIRNKRLAYVKGYGFADVEAGVSVTTNTVFNWASNSKPVMAIAALQLVQKNMLELDVGIRTYIPDLPESLEYVTTRHLLCHQSGIPHYFNGKIVPTNESTPLEKQIDPRAALNRFLNSPLLYEPGANSTYSSYAYVMLSAVVQAAGEEEIASQISRRIITPLRLNSFQLDVPFKDEENWTLGYRIGPSGEPQKVKDTAHFWKHGAGGYKSNIKDFAKWTVALMNNKVISKQTATLMWQAQRLSSGEPTKYGLGVLVSGKGRQLKISHSGSQDETKTRMVFYPYRGSGIVVLCNTAHADPGKISTAIYKAMSRN